MRTDTDPRFAKSAPGGECWPWRGARSSAGYGVVRVGSKLIGAHRVAYERKYGPIPPGAHIMHRCDRPECVNPAHLSAGSQAQNMQQCRDRGRHPNQRLTWRDVRRIRRGTATDTENAEEYGITRQHACLIRLGKRWREVVA